MPKATDSSSNNQNNPKQPPEKKRVKRSYSKNGCQECKRRKLKCDEAKPNCGHCLKLGKDCVYAPPKKVLGWNKALVFTPVEFEQQLKLGLKPKGLPAGSVMSVERTGGPNGSNVGKTNNSTIGTGTNINGNTNSGSNTNGERAAAPIYSNGPGADSNGTNSDILGSSGGPDNVPDNGLNNHQNFIQPPQFVTGQEISQMFDPHYQTTIPTSNISELAVVLNNLLTSQMDEVSAHYPEDITNIPESCDETFLNFLSEAENGKWDSVSLLSSPVIPITTETVQNPDQWESDPELGPSNNQFNHSKYLRTFSDVFSSLVMPFLDERNNTLRYYLLSYSRESQYLMAALLSSGARIQHRESGSNVDERAHYFYLSYCLKLLASCLVDETKLAYQTEPMLLTVLVLTCDCACSFTSSWRAHLRGAKDLLKRLFSNSTHYKTSPVVVLCTMWFASIDMLASVSAPYGGTLQNDDDLNEMSNSDQPNVAIKLQKLHIISRDGYNRFLGYKNVCLPLFKRLIRLTWQVNPFDAEKAKPKLWPQDQLVSEVHGLYQDLREAVKLYEISPTCIIPDDYDLSSLPKSAYGEIEVEDDGNNSDKSGRRIIHFSWLDMVHQGNVRSALILLLTTPGMYGLPADHELVQECVNKNLELFVFLDDLTAKQRNLPDDQRFAKLKNSYSLMMTQWFLYITGKYSITDLQRQRVTDVFKAVMNFGKAQSANVVLQELERLWSQGWESLLDQKASKVDLLPY